MKRQPRVHTINRYTHFHNVIQFTSFMPFSSFLCVDAAVTASDAKFTWDFFSSAGFVSVIHVDVYRTGTGKKNVWG